MVITFDVEFPKTSDFGKDAEIIKNLLRQDSIKPDSYNGVKFPKRKQTRLD